MIVKVITSSKRYYEVDQTGTLLYHGFIAVEGMTIIEKEVCPIFGHAAYYNATRYRKGGAK